MAFVGGGAVHHAVLVVEDPQVPDLVGELVGLGGGVVVGDPDQHQDAGSDLAGDLVRPTVTFARLTRCTSPRIESQPTLR